MQQLQPSRSRPTGAEIAKRSYAQSKGWRLMAERYPARVTYDSARSLGVVIGGRDDG